MRKLKNAKSNIKKKSKSDIDLSLYSRLWKDFIFLSRFCFGNYVQTVESKLKQNPKNFWNFINLKRKPSGFPSKMSYNSVSSSDSKTIVDWFTENFQKTYNSSDFNIGNNYDNNTLSPITDCCFFYVEKDEVIKAVLWIGSIDLSRFPSESLSAPLQFIFNQSLSCGYFFEDWKFSFCSSDLQMG